MLTVAVFSQKGGAGKSTLAVHLAVAASRSLNVILVDADQQATVANWAAGRKHSSPFIARAEPSSIEQLLAAARDEGFDLAVIDCPPHAAPGTAALLRSADHIVIPSQPTMPDLAATARSVALARATGKSHSFGINRAPTRAPEVAQAVAALSTGGVVSPVVIGDPSRLVEPCWIVLSRSRLAATLSSWCMSITAETSEGFTVLIRFSLALIGTST